MHLIETAKSPRIWQPVPLTGSYTVDFDMAYPVLNARPQGRVLDERINDLSPLPPESHFRNFTFYCAKRFVQEMERKRERYHLHTAEGDLRIRGPFMTKDMTGTMHADGFEQHELLNPESVDFHITGMFVAEYGFWVEMPNEDERKKIQAVSFEQWKKAETAAGARLRRN